MRAIFLFVFVFHCSQEGITQLIKERLTTAMHQLEADPQVRHAIMGISIVDTKTGKSIFSRNSQVGLAPASTLKIVTSIAAFDLLGKDYQYETTFGYSGKLENGIIEGNLYIHGTGDPSLGSWRFENTTEERILTNWQNELINRKVTGIRGEVKELVNDSQWSTQTIPGGWIWDDLGNYYGAGAGPLNWRENQFDLLLHPGKNNGDKVQIMGTTPTLFDFDLKSEVTTSSPNSGDNAYIYLPFFGGPGFVRGTVPSGNDTFVISGTLPNPAQQLTKALELKLNESNIKVFNSLVNQEYEKTILKEGILTIHRSPPFDSLNYWFLKKSINLYGEAFIKTIAYKKEAFGSTEKGVEIVKDFFASKGFDRTAINIIDGSGLSPQNRVTTEVLVQLLQYAQNRSWYPSFFAALPEYNKMKMKSGSIYGVRAFAGYHKATNGKVYTFSFIINNFNGSGSEIVSKMYKVLDILK